VGLVHTMSSKEKVSEEGGTTQSDIRVIFRSLFSAAHGTLASHRNLSVVCLTTVDINSSHHANDTLHDDLDCVGWKALPLSHSLAHALADRPHEPHAMRSKYIQNQSCARTKWACCE
jgi:hypothetical protein